MTTWHEVTQSCDAWIADALQTGDLTWETADDWAWETADGCEYSIYYRHHDDLWSEGGTTPVHEVEPDLDLTGLDTQGRIAACVVYAINRYLHEQAHVVLQQHSRWETYVGEQRFWSSVDDAGFSIPVLQGRWVLDRGSLLAKWERELLGYSTWVPTKVV